MLYYLLYPLRNVIVGFNVFRYITFRTAFAALTALLISFIFGPGACAPVGCVTVRRGWSWAPRCWARSATRWGATFPPTCRPQSCPSGRPPPSR